MPILPFYKQISYEIRDFLLFCIACSLYTLAILSSAEAQAQNPTLSLPPTVTQALEQAQLPPTALSAYVIAVDANTPRLSWHADTPRNPASTMKLLTTWAGFELLGPSYQWHTSIYADRLPVQGILHSDLYILGEGDPKLTPEELTLLLQTLRQNGVEEIDGNLVFDKSIFISGPNADQTIDGETERPYNVAPDPLLYAFKTLIFTLEPTLENHQINITVLPQLAQLQINNRLKPFPDTSPSSISSSCSAWKADVKRQDNGIVQADFSGSYPTHCGTQKYQIALLNHTEFFWGGFISAWRDIGGRFTHIPTVREGTIPPHAQLIASHAGPPLQDIATDINKFSNNVMARQLFLTLGTKLAGAPAYEPSTAIAFKKWLETQNLPMPELLIENGSGLSRQSQITAIHMAQLLQRAANGPLINTLPIVGVDGTMKHRLTNSPIVNRAWIKTGALKNVRAIAGYVQAYNDQRYIVVSMINHDQALSGKQAHDALLQWVYEGADNSKDQEINTPTPKTLLP